VRDRGRNRGSGGGVLASIAHLVGRVSTLRVQCGFGLSKQEVHWGEVVLHGWTSDCKSHP
jgi:hypothetical protein